MFEPKTYQQETLEWLRKYLEEARLSGAQAAFDAIRQQNLRTHRAPYHSLAGLEEIPYVCLRLPTGGGKTYLAARSIAVAASAYLEQEFPLVLWMTPTNTIRAQTLATLNNPTHPNRQLLNEAFGHSRVMVLDITDFANIRPQDIGQKLIIVVSTLATPRVSSTDLRKIYAHHEALEPHFASLPASTPNMERGENKRIKYSFRNLLALHNPLVIIDEAHNATSDLSVEVLQRIRPAAIIEFTATPAESSNVLHAVSALELKTEEMIKLPIVLTQHNTWQEAVTDAVLQRNQLHELARLDRDFIHPIVLFQAEEKGRQVTYEVIKEYLIQGLNIAPERIAIATGNQRELDGVNLLDPDNKVEFVITVEALKEGWDCPFAYVFCSVATIHSKKDIEQILGRVLRMPYAKKRSQEALNRAYAHVSATSWPQAVSQLEDRLISMGFEEQEAETVIYPQPPLPHMPPEAQPGSLFAGVGDTFKLILSAVPALVYLSAEELGRVAVRKLGEGRVELEVNGVVDADFEKKLVEAVAPKDRNALQRTIAVFRKRQPHTPAQRGARFEVPQLCLWVDGQLETVEPEFYLPPGGWRLLQYPPELNAAEFSIQEQAQSYLIDINGRRLTTRFLGTQPAIEFDDIESGWTNLQLSRWLEGEIYQPDIRQEEMLEFIRRTIVYLVTQRRISLTHLVRGRYLLEKALQEKIKQYRQIAHQQGFQGALFADNAPVETSLEYAFAFDPDNYAIGAPYTGRYQFERHYYPIVGNLDEKGEEFECAQAIDRCPQVAYWVRNIESKPQTSFRLPLANGHFYPDFVAKLKDGRTLVVEYKGEHLDEHEQPKKNIGELWEASSQGQALFLWAMRRDTHGRDVTRQLEAKVK